MMEHGKSIPFGADVPQQSASSMDEYLMSDEGEQEATPEEQAMYDLVVARAVKYMHGEGKDQTLKLLSSGTRPAESIGRAAATIAKGIRQSAQEQGKEISDDVLFNAGIEIVEELAAYGRAAGVFDFASDEEAQKETEQGLLYALKFFGESGLADGSFSEDAIAQAKQTMMQGIADEEKYGNPAVRGGVQQAMQPSQGAPQGPVMNPGLINNANRMG